LVYCASGTDCPQARGKVRGDDVVRVLGTRRRPCGLDGPGQHAGDEVRGLAGGGRSRPGST